MPCPVLERMPGVVSAQPLEGKPDILAIIEGPDRLSLADESIALFRCRRRLH